MTRTTGGAGEISFRQAAPGDAAGMAHVLDALAAAGTRANGATPDDIRARYLDHPHQLSCLVAERGARVLGFQSLKQSWPGNPYDVPKGWGIIGTHLHPDAQGQGIGRLLFDKTVALARQAGLVTLDATIGAKAAQALGYYSAMGFCRWRRLDSAVGKRLDL